MKKLKNETRKDNKLPAVQPAASRPRPSSESSLLVKKEPSKKIYSKTVRTGTNISGSKNEPSSSNEFKDKKDKSITYSKRSSSKKSNNVLIRRSSKAAHRKTDPLDASVQLQQFLQDRKPPKFQYSGSRESVSKALSRPINEVKTEYLDVAINILEKVKRETGTAGEFAKACLGEPISKDTAEQFLENYVHNNGIHGKLHIRWTTDINIAGKFQEVGSKEDPEKRQILVWINSNYAGVLHDLGARSFADHEICTHALRAINDRHQPWATERKRFGLHTLGSRASASSEEGLACLHSLLSRPSNLQYLWSPAMMYYCAARGKKLNFIELFDDLGNYIDDPTNRYWFCVRAKKCILDHNQPGSIGKAQIYLEGAVEILRKLHSIDFKLMYSGKVSIDKLGRIKRLVRTSGVILPKYMDNFSQYMQTLSHIAELNGIVPDPAEIPPEVSPSNPSRKQPKSLAQKKTVPRKPKGKQKKKCSGRKNKLVKSCSEEQLTGQNPPKSFGTMSDTIASQQHRSSSLENDEWSCNDDTKSDRNMHSNQDIDGQYSTASWTTNNSEISTSAPLSDFMTENGNKSFFLQGDDDLSVECLCNTDEQKTSFGKKSGVVQIMHRKESHSQRRSDQQQKSHYHQYLSQDGSLFAEEDINLNSQKSPEAEKKRSYLKVMTVMPDFPSIC